MAQDLATKLLIEPDQTVLVLNAPIGYAKKLEPLPAGVTVTDKRGKPAQVALVFVRDSGELKRFASGFPALEADAVLWVCYPAGGKSDIDADALNAALQQHELAGSSIVALDEAWSAMRLRAPEDDES